MHMIGAAGVTITTETIYRGLLLLLAAGVALTLAIAWRWPYLGDQVLSRIEDWGCRLSTRRAASVIATFLLVIVVRLSLWPLLGMPVPQVHDEFSYLLAADTFAHGRLTNPPHPMWIYLETFHVNQLPTYMSKYPPGQGAVLALGQLLGHPWIGVLLSVAVLCGTITWMLQGWVPSRWALLGGIIAVAQFGATNYWMESYFGGAVAAIGGALVMGALPRVRRRWRSTDAILLAVGTVILANSRPYEGLVFCIPFFAVLGFWFLKAGKLDWANATLRVAIPVAAVMILAGVFMAYYNWRVTGDPLLLPYAVNQRAYFSSPLFVWGKLGPAHQYSSPQLAAFYNAQRADWLSAHLNGPWAFIKHRLPGRMATFLNFYAPPQLGLPILASLLAIHKNRKICFCFGLCALLASATLVVLWLNPHYLAPLTAPVYVLIVFGLRHLRLWSFNKRAVGIGLVRALVVFHLALLPVQAGALSFIHSRGYGSSALARARARMEAKLESTPGEHLVVVRYAQGYEGPDIWVYNRADINHSKVVWAREIPGLEINPLLNYFRGRTVWMVEPGVVRPGFPHMGLSPWAENKTTESPSDGHNTTSR